MNPSYKPAFSSLPEGTTVSLKIYATVGNQVTLIGTYKVTISYSAATIANVAKSELLKWAKATDEEKYSKKEEYFSIGCDGEEYKGRAWCAAFVSYCIRQGGYSDVITGSPSCVNLRKQFANKGRYMSNYSYEEDKLLANIAPGDVVFLIGGQKVLTPVGSVEPLEPHHVGIVTKVGKDANGVWIDYIDGNTTAADGKNGIGEKKTYYIKIYKDGTYTQYNNVLGFGLFHSIK